MATAVILTTAAATATPDEYHGIRVVDEATGRGVPLVELRTTNNVSWWTDSAGWVAFLEPGQMDATVHLTIHADGYEYPADGFNIRGVRVRTTPATTTEIRVKRTQIAERLYRITGAGIYRDSALLGQPLPPGVSNLNAKVSGQDSVIALPYKGRIMWFWGDTAWPEYPLGNFASSGAWTPLPGPDTWDPAVGVPLVYYTGENGFSRAVTDVPGEGMKWIDGMAVLTDPHGRERLVGKLSRMKSLGETLERLTIVWDDERETFVPLGPLPLGTTLIPGGARPVRWQEGGREYLLFNQPFANIRVEARWEAFIDPAQYEGFTPLAPGTVYTEGSTVLERDADGKLVYTWKRGTEPLTAMQERDLVKAGLMTDEECHWQPADWTTGTPVLPWGGTLAWNPHRGRWIALVNEAFGKPSFLGELWYAEADAPTGPWRHAVKVVTHAVHSAYNVAHHPFLDGDGGRVLYFEATYTDTFSSAVPTPRYNYNQIMFRIDLADPRLRMEGTPPYRQEATTP